MTDPLEDEDVKHVWSWELRDVKVLPKAQRQQAQALKKSLLKVVSQHTCTSHCVHLMACTLQKMQSI